MAYTLAFRNLSCRETYGLFVGFLTNADGSFRSLVGVACLCGARDTFMYLAFGGFEDALVSGWRQHLGFGGWKFTQSKTVELEPLEFALRNITLHQRRCVLYSVPCLYYLMLYPSLLSWEARHDAWHGEITQS